MNASTSADHFDSHDPFVTRPPAALEGFDVNLTVETVFDATCKPSLMRENAPGMNAKLPISKSAPW